MGLIKGDTRSLDYGSNGMFRRLLDLCLAGVLIHMLWPLANLLGRTSATGKSAVFRIVGPSLK